MQEQSTKLAKIRRGGSTNKVIKEWVLIRILATLSIPLLIYIIVSMLLGNASSYLSLKTWLNNPINAVIMLLTVAMVSWHGVLGLVTVLHDYVSNKAKQWFYILLVKSFFGFITVCSLVSILFIIFKN